MTWRGSGRRRTGKQVRSANPSERSRYPQCCVCILGFLSTEALGGVKNLQVTDPTTNSLKVRWEPAEGNVRQYRVVYVPASGGAEDTVSRFPLTVHRHRICQRNSPWDVKRFVCAGAGVGWHHQHCPQEPVVKHALHCHRGSGLPRGRRPAPVGQRKDT